jgi:hypothetical protein
MLGKIIIAAAAAGILAGTATVASSQSRHHGFEYAPSYGQSYMGERSDPTNTNGN